MWYAYNVKDKEHYCLLTFHIPSVPTYVLFTYCRYKYIIEYRIVGIDKENYSSKIALNLEIVFVSKNYLYTYT